MASADDREKLLAEVKRDVRSLLISAKSGLAIQDLYRDYQSLVFNPLPFRQLGFQTARSFLQSIPDVCRCQLLPGGDCLVTAVADSSTAHIQKMVERQKSSQKRGATARVLASRYVRRSMPARSSVYRPPALQSQVWHRTSSTTQTRPEPKPPTPPKPKPAPERQEEVVAGRGSPEPVPARVAGRLAQVLLAHQDGVPAERLSDMYDAATPGDEPLDWAGRGFRNCADLLLRLPHIARVVNTFNGLCVYPSRALIAADRESAGGDRQSRQSTGTDGRQSRQSTGTDGQQSRQSAGADGGGDRQSCVAGGGDDQKSRQSAADRSVGGADGGRSAQREGSPEPESERRPSPAGASGRAVTSGSSSSGRRKGLLTSISETIQTIVEEHPNGLLCSKLPAEYQLKTGGDLALAELGYHSVLDLVSRLPLRIIKSNAFGDWLLFTVRQPLPEFVNDQTQADDGLLAEVRDGSRLREAKERIRDILLSFPDGLRMASLEDHYQMNCNERLPYAALGFSSVETFVLHLTEDVLTVKFTADDLKLFPIMPPQSEQAVTRDLYPEDAVGPGRSFERVKMPDVPSGEYNLEIFVAEVYHPHKFWFHLVGEEYAEALEKLMDEMEMTYCTTLGFKYRMQEATVRVGQVIACPYGEQGYHRAVITAVRPAPEPVKVFYVDYGSVGTVARDFLRFLPEQYFSLPAQALLGRLANIDPPDADGWSREASKMFLSLVDNNRILYAMVLDRSPSCVSLCLCDTNGATDLHVNDRLVELDFAVFHHQAAHVDEKAVEELSRPVSVAPSPRSVAVAPADVSEAAGVRLSPEPPLAGRSSAQSDIDRLLQEALGNQTTAEPAASPTPATVSPSVQSQPPGFSGLPPPLPAPVTPAIAQMLTQSALLNNLQMQLNLLNPMMNPAYAALLMSGGAAVSAAQTPVGPPLQPPGAPGQPLHPSCLLGYTPVSSAGLPVPVAVSSGAAPLPSSPDTPAPVSTAPPLAPSVVSSGQDAGVCITAPIRADSAPSRQELTEDEIAQMNQELGELAIQRRFIKRISVPVGVVHLICLEGAGYLVSAEISHFLWTRDILNTMLRMKRVTLPCRAVDVESHQELFHELVKYNVPGVMDGDELVDPLTLYPITCVPRVLAVFKSMKKEHDVKGIIEDIIAEFDPADPYWTSADEEEDELAELCSETALGSPAPRPGSLHLDLGPPPTESGAVLSAAAAPFTEGPGQASDLLPEMRTILSQLQNKRRRKVEATMMGLEGTDFSPEDVIGDDLRRMDSQIASFQRRIDALVVARATGQAGSLQESALRPASVRRPSVSMNPDAPEFVQAAESVYAGGDSTSTVCPLDGAEPVTPRARAPVELRAPDGTPVDLSQLVSRAQALQRRHSGGSAAPAPTTPPRKLLELRTPDGRPVQLGRPSRDASAPDGSSVLSVAASAPVTGVTAAPAAVTGVTAAPAAVTGLGVTAAPAAVTGVTAAPAPGASAAAGAAIPVRVCRPPPSQAAAPLQPQPPPAGYQPPQLPRYSQPAGQHLPAQLPPQQQWPRMQQPGQHPAYGVPLYAAPYQQPYLAYQQMYQPAPFARLGFPAQQLYPVPQGYQPPPPPPAYPGK